MAKTIAIIRLRGRTGRNYHIEHTLKLLKLHKPNHLVIYQESESLFGMLHKVKDAVTWGEVNNEMIEHILKKRGELQGKNKLSDKHVKSNSEYASVKQFSKAIFKGEAKIKDLTDLQPVFRLSPPRKGFKSLKNPVNRKGDLGYRGEAINELLARMA
ncbi:MAG: 50S ribosomal protein L30P [Candidatus Heimdallarchaeota archaeon LC_2]|nr:MAG: 50S ribosomal protein L30P [Candidatus Heimdallarchaeota archaeon LC_2]